MNTRFLKGFVSILTTSKEQQQTFWAFILYHIFLQKIKKGLVCVSLFLLELSLCLKPFKIIIHDFPLFFKFFKLVFPISFLNILKIIFQILSLVS